MSPDFASSFSLASFADPTTLDSDVTAILRQWAGVENIDPDSRSAGAITNDARDLTFLEHLFGTDFSQWGQPDPLHYAGEIVENIWHDEMDTFKADLVMQLGGAALFDSAVTYDPYTGNFDGTLHLSHTAISDLASTDAPGADAPAQAFWVSIADSIDHSEGISNLDSDEQSWLNDAVTSTTTVTWSDIVDQYDHTNPGLSYEGTSGDDTYTGSSGDDTIYGEGGNDTLHGGAGDDTIIIGTGDSTVYGDAGNDTIEVVGGGNNSLYGGDGDDTIYGDTGNNLIDGGAGGNFLHGGSGPMISSSAAAMMSFRQEAVAIRSLCRPGSIWATSPLPVFPRTEAISISTTSSSQYRVVGRWRSWTTF